MTDTLKSICDQCTHLKDPQLEFLSSEFARHREIILRDIRELTAAASAENEKTVVILAGCLIESVLYCFIRSQQEYISSRSGDLFQFNPNRSLQFYVGQFNHYFREVTDVTLPDAVVQYRDLVHINREINCPPGVCTIASRETLRTLNALIGCLSRFAEPTGAPQSPGSLLNVLRNVLATLVSKLKQLIT